MISRLATIDSPSPPPEDEIGDEYHLYAVEQVERGVAAGEIVSSLEARGADPLAARRLVADLERCRSRELDDASRRDIIGGVVLCAVGGLATFVSYVSAKPGGTYVISVGVILYGVFKLLRGFLEIGTR